MLSAQAPRAWLNGKPDHLWRSNITPNPRTKKYAASVRSPLSRLARRDGNPGRRWEARDSPSTGRGPRGVLIPHARLLDEPWSDRQRRAAT
jgi:hypothetical protein